MCVWMCELTVVKGGMALLWYPASILWAAKSRAHVEVRPTTSRGACFCWCVSWLCALLVSRQWRSCWSPWSWRIAATTWGWAGWVESHTYSIFNSLHIWGRSSGLFTKFNYRAKPWCEKGLLLWVFFIRFNKTPPCSLNCWCCLLQLFLSSPNKFELFFPKIIILSLVVSFDGSCQQFDRNPGNWHKTLHTSHQIHIRQLHLFSHHQGEPLSPVVFHSETLSINQIIRKSYPFYSPVFQTGVVDIVCAVFVLHTSILTFTSPRVLCFFIFAFYWDELFVAFCISDPCQAWVRPCQTPTLWDKKKTLLITRKKTGWWFC